MLLGDAVQVDDRVVLALRPDLGVPGARLRLGEHRLVLEEPDRGGDLTEERQGAVLELLAGVAGLQVLGGAPLDEVGGAELGLPAVHGAGDPAVVGGGVDDLAHRGEQAVLLLGGVGGEQVEDGQVLTIGCDLRHSLLFR
ncbi:hypothetical protein WKI71_17640 [Streptomyces sp. MS1.AVA.1]|uniref:Uncharacterized protein n=1 Tax=Streptomyces machairae TaxID=3134109 RepID=A0ABU8UL02_9ACTN